jgi:hypothetical protein
MYLPPLDLMGFSAATPAGWLCPLQAFTALGAASPFLSPLIIKKTPYTFPLNAFNLLLHTLCMKTE